MSQDEHKLVRFRCPHCSAVLRGKKSDGGARRKCPSCHQVFRIPRVRVAEADQSVDPEQELIPVVCSVCQTRMYATVDQVDAFLECPDCFTQNVVKAPAPKAHKPNAVTAAGMTYDMRPQAEISVTKDYAEDLLAEASQKVEQEIEEQPKLPERPLFSGVFTFPFYRQSFPVVLGMAIGLCFVFGIIKGAMGLEGHAALMAPVILALAGFSIVCITLPTIVSLVRVFENTIQGEDDADFRPDGGLFAFFDWIGDVFFFILAIALCSGPLVALVSWTSLPLEQRHLLVVLVASIPFPVVLLSMMENSSPLGFYSHPVWTSLAQVPGAWFKFYLTSTILVALGEACLFALAQLAGASWSTGMMAAAAAVVFSLTVLTTIYFRLLGRLGWLLTEQIMVEVEPSAQDAAEYRDQVTADGESKYSVGI